MVRNNITSKNTESRPRDPHRAVGSSSGSNFWRRQGGNWSIGDVCFINVLVYKRLSEKGGDIFRYVVDFRVLK